MSHCGKIKDITTGEMTWKRGMSAKEIAIVLGTTENAVWQILASGLKKIRIALKDKKDLLYG